MKRCAYPFLLAAFVGAAPASEAQSDEWLLIVDPSSSEIRFTLGATLHSVLGTVELERGEILFDRRGGRLSGELVADARSASTGHPGRDRDMHSRVLESERYPHFVLRPDEIRGDLQLSGTSRVEIGGELTLHGGTHRVLAPTEVRIDGERVTATARFSVPYVAWGMKDPSKLFLRVRKVVEVEVRLSGTVRLR